MKETFITDLKPGSLVRSTFLVQDKQPKTASNGSPYLDLILRDATGIIVGKIWDSDRHKLEFEREDVVMVEGNVEEYRGSPQIKVRKIARCQPQEVNPLDYLPRSREDPAQMYATLLARVERVEEGPLRTLLLATLRDPAIAEKYKLAPAAMSFHHAYLGGLLEHVLSLIELGDKVCDHYPMLRRDLVLAGLVLHDIGKIEELSFSGGFRYSTRGKLVGHISIGLGIVQEKIRTIPDFPALLKDQLEHIILSHHGELEFGSPVLPMFPEALAVHFLDNLDSKLETVRAQYETEKGREGDWTSRNPALKRELLKPSAD